MKKTKIDNSMEQRFLLAMISSKEFLAGASTQPILSLFEAPYLKLVAQWCIEYFETYDEAPGASVKTLYSSWRAKTDRSVDDVDAVKEILDNLAPEYESDVKVNASYLLDELGDYLATRQLKILSEEVEDCLITGDLSGAIQEVQKFRVPEVGRACGIDPLNQTAPWESAFGPHTESLIQFPGDAGKFLNVAMTREALIGIQGPEKRGKTFWCMEFVIQSLMQRRKVAFFQVGDLSESQVLRRLGVRLAARPMWKEQCGEIRYPVSIEVPHGKGEPPTVKWKKKICTSILTQDSSIRAISGFLKRCGIPKDVPYLMMANHPTGTVNVRDVGHILDQWEVERGFIPDVIVIDYADILSPESSRSEGRDRYNETWAALRRMSQERRALVITPTQADANSYDQRIQGMKNFSEDKRKLSHVTGLLGLNQEDREKDLQIMRLNWIVLRESPHQTRQCLYTGHCLALGRMMTCSRLSN